MKKQFSILLLLLIGGLTVAFAAEEMASAGGMTKLQACEYASIKASSRARKVAKRKAVIDSTTCDCEATPTSNSKWRCIARVRYHDENW